METETKHADPVLSRRNGSLLNDYWQETYPGLRLNFSTIKRYVLNHKQFFDEIFRGDFTGKARPIPFLLFCMTPVLLMTALDVEESPEWHQVYLELPPAETAAFLQAFGLPESASGRDDGDTWARFLGNYTNPFPEIDSVLRARMGVLDPSSKITVDQVSTYLGAQDLGVLALRFEHTNCRVQEGKSLNPVMDAFFPEMLLLFILPVFALSHFVLKPAGRNLRETMEVYIYSNAIAQLLQTIPLLFLKIPGLSSENVLIGNLTYLALILYIAVKTTRIFRYTHQVGFWRLFRANMLAGFYFVGLLVAAGIVLVLAYMLLTEDNAQ